MIRLWVEVPLFAGAQVQAAPNQAHYFTHVMRRGPGDEALLFNGSDGEWRARALSAGRGQALFLAETETRPQLTAPDFCLAFALLKRDATDLVVRQATELGATRLLPVMTERTNTARVNLERLTAIAIEAAEQSERLCIPDIRPPVPLATLLAAWPEHRLLAAAIERADASPVPAATALLIGPEGGFSPAELDALRPARFIAPIHLGPHILRAETAAAAGLALLQAMRWSTN